MGRTAAPAMPGTDPAAPQPDDKALGVDPALLRDEAPKDVTLADALAMIASLQSQVKSIGRNQAVQHQPPVDLPELADIMAKKPDFSVLTKQGWYVPAVLPQQRAV